MKDGCLESEINRWEQDNCILTFRQLIIWKLEAWTSGEIIIHTSVCPKMTCSLQLEPGHKVGHTVSRRLMFDGHQFEKARI
jgi:hypothetical protein